MSETSNFGFGGNPDIEAALSEAQERTELSPDLKQDPTAIGWLVEELAGIYERQLEAEDATIAGLLDEYYAKRSDEGLNA